MATPDFAWTPDAPPLTRLDAAKRAFKLFVAGGDGPGGTHFDGRPADQIGLVTFAAVPQTACPLTLNHSVLLAVLDEQQPRQGIDAGTNIGDALAEAEIRLDAAGHRRKVLLLLSDGEHNVTREGANAPLKPFASAQLAVLNWCDLLVYPKDRGGRKQLVRATLKMPDGWKVRLKSDIVNVVTCWSTFNSIVAL